MLTAFNHYLLEGSEFDQAVAVELLAKGARTLLQEGRSPVLFTVEVSGDRAIEVGERWLRDGEMPGLVRHVLQFWAHRLHDPTLDPGTQHVDFGLMFYEDIPPDWVADAALVRFPSGAPKVAGPLTAQTSALSFRCGNKRGA